MPGRSLILISVEVVDLSKRIKSRVDLESLSVLLGQKSEKLIVLGSQFKNESNSDYNIFQIGIIIGLALPFVALILTSPEVSCQLCGAVFPPTADAHALIELDSDIGELTLPNVILSELLLDSGAKRLCHHLEEVFHSGLWISWVDPLVPPDGIKNILSRVNETTHLPKVKILNLSNLTGNLLEVLVDGLGFLAKALILLGADVLTLELLPALDLIHWADDSSELVDAEVYLEKGGASLSHHFL